VPVTLLTSFVLRCYLYFTVHCIQYYFAIFLNTFYHGAGCGHCIALFGSWSS